MAKGREEKKARVRKLHEMNKVKLELFEESKKDQPVIGDTMKKLQVKSNYARDRVVVLDNGKLVLHFDHRGVAEMPAHKLEVLQREMVARPGRYKVLEEEAAPAAVEVDEETIVTMRAQVESALAALTEDDEDDEDEPELDDVESDDDGGEELSELELDVTEEE